jgi:microcystin-dependent protein
MGSRSRFARDLFVAVPIALAVALATQAVGRASPSDAVISFQARITQDGIPTTGDLDLTFEVYGQSSGGSSLWTEAHADVPVRNGLLNVNLGASQSLAGVFVSGADRFVAVKLTSTGQELVVPRVQLTAVPYAMNAAPSLPAGFMQAFGGSSAPSGWLECDGSAVSRTTYSDLFSAIGTTWGAGNGSTTFNVPDLRGRAPIGAGTGSGLSARILGASVGAETHQLTVDEIPPHSHQIPYRSFGTTGAAVVVIQQAQFQSLISPPVTANTGGGAAHNNMQPSAVVKWLIKT